MLVVDIVLAILNEMQGEGDPTGLGIDDKTKGVVVFATSIGAVAGILLFGVVVD